MVGAPKANSGRKGVKSTKTKDTGGFLRLFRHVLVEITVWSTDHSIPHHQKPLLHSSNNCKERLGDAQISMCEDTEGK